MSTRATSGKRRPSTTSTAGGAEVPELALTVVRATAAFRASLRRFERTSEQIALERGLTPRRYLLLLMIKGALDGSERATVSELTERLQLAQHTVTELVGRAEQAGLIRRERSGSDGRVSYLRLTAEGERRLGRAFTDLDTERQTLMAALRESPSPSNTRSQPMPANVRSIPALWRLRQRRNAVIVCREDPSEYEALRNRLGDLQAALVVEDEARALSEALGRLSVTVDRYGTVGFKDEHPSPARVLTQLEAFEMFCSECTVPLWEDPGA